MCIKSLIKEAGNVDGITELAKLLPQNSPVITGVALVLIIAPFIMKLLKFRSDNHRLQMKFINEDLETAKADKDHKKILEEFKSEQILYRNTKIMASKKGTGNNYCLIPIPVL